MTPMEMGQATLLIVGIAFAMIWALALLLQQFVALRAEPTRRATWTVGIPYVLTAVALMFALPAAAGQFFSPVALALIAPFAAIPGGLATFWWWRRSFKSAWVDDPADLPEGVELANDDWRVGLLILTAVLVIAAIKAFFREL